MYYLQITGSSRPYKAIGASSLVFILIGSACLKVGGKGGALKCYIHGISNACQVSFHTMILLELYPNVILETKIYQILTNLRKQMPE